MINFGLKLYCAIITIILVGAVLHGCYEAESRQEKSQPFSYRDVPTHPFNFDVEIILVEDCEYVHIHNYRSGGLAHKGNCKNPAHKVK